MSISGLRLRKLLIQLRKQAPFFELNFSKIYFNFYETYISKNNYLGVVLVLRNPPLSVTAFNTSSSSIMVTWTPLTPESVPGILLGYVLRITKADNANTSNFRELEHGLGTRKNVTNLEVYTLYIIYVAGYTRKGNGSFRAAQSWTDEGGR